jgi:putative hemolysin
MPTQLTRQSLSIRRFFNEPLRSLLNPAEPAIQKIFAFDELWQVYEAARTQSAGAGAVERVLDLLSITYELAPSELEHIPKSGPVLAVANHPFGLLEGALLSVLLPRVRPDVKILANSLLAGFPELSDRCIFIDPFGHTDSVHGNAKALRECLAWLCGGGMLVAFPAGEVAQPDWRGQTPADPPWNPSLARIAKRAGASAVPIFFAGSNSVAFQLAGIVHPSLRTASLPRELLNKRGRRISIRMGRPVSSATLDCFATAREATEYLRCRTYLLGTPEPTHFAGLRTMVPQGFPRRTQPIAEPQPPTAISEEISSLAPGRKLCESADFAIYLGTQDEFPTVVKEIGRLREIAFRGAGEGTGRSVDLDRFDPHYLHLVLWSRSGNQIAGAYRLGPTPDILPRHGIAGLYTSTLFRYRPELFAQVGPAIELGRSFIRPEFQKQYAPLYLLWKGIAKYAMSRPDCPRLFGAVSVSNAYHPVSRYLIVKFLETRREEDLARFVTPRVPYRPEWRALRRTGVVSRVPEAIDQLSNLIAEVESDGKGIPILVKQYLRAGGKLLGFSVDRAFSQTLDALLMVDLRAAPQALLERYLGKSGVSSSARRAAE